MKAGVLLLWGCCLLSLAGAVVRFIWLSPLWERLLLLSLAAAAICFRRSPRSCGREGARSSAVPAEGGSPSTPPRSKT